MNAAREAARRGAQALATLPPTVRGPSGRWRRVRPMSSPFVAAAGCEALYSAVEDVGPLAAYLRDTREPDGSWSFAPREGRWPPDADSTSCALAALARAAGVAQAPVLRRIIDAQRDTDGLIRPWLLWYPEAHERLDGNVADAVVTANVLFAASRVGEDGAALVAALEDHVSSNGLERLATVYYNSLPVRSYYLARALAPVSFNGPTARTLRELLPRIRVDTLDCVDAAAALAASALLGIEPAPALASRLLALQRSDGTWPESRWFVDPAGVVWRSRAASTALAVEALFLFAGTKVR